MRPMSAPPTRKMNGVQSRVQLHVDQFVHSCAMRVVRGYVPSDSEICAAWADTMKRRFGGTLARSAGVHLL